MKDEEKLLNEMILSLNRLGLNWFHILDDYLDYQLEQKQISTDHFDNIKNIIVKLKYK